MRMNMQISDNPRLLAVCHDCQKKHVITDRQLMTADSVRDWEIKHRRHCVEFLDPLAYDISIAKRAVGDYRHNADVKLAYSADADYTITLASLATSATLLTGRESASVSNGSNLYLDYMISGVITTGTSPTADTSIEVIAIGSEDDTPTWPDVFDGTDSAAIITSSGVKNAIARYLAVITAASTSNVGYSFGPVSLTSIFGVCPTNHAVFVTHNTAVNLNSTGGLHVITYHGVYATVT